MALKLVILACSLIGFVSASHLAALLVRERFIRAVDMTKIGTVTSVLVGASALSWPPSSLFDAWLRLFAPVIITLIFAFLLAKRRQARFDRDFPSLLGNLIMRMRTGCSLQMSLEEELRRNHSSTRLHLLSIVRVVTFSPQTESDHFSNSSLGRLPPKILAVAEEFRRIHLLPSRQIDELERWRARVQASEIFRRKSKQAMAQARTQAVVLAIIYLCLSLFVSLSFGWKVTKGPLQISIPFFFVGIFWMWKGGRRVKWTI